MKDLASVSSRKMALRSPRIGRKGVVWDEVIVGTGQSYDSDTASEKMPARGARISVETC